MPKNHTQEVNKLIESGERLMTSFEGASSLKELNAYLDNLIRMLHKYSAENNQLESHTWYKLNTLLKEMKDKGYGTVQERKNDKEQDIINVRASIELRCKAATAELQEFTRVEKSQEKSNMYGQLPGEMRAAPAVTPVVSNTYGQLPGEMRATSSSADSGASNSESKPVAVAVATPIASAVTTRPRGIVRTQRDTDLKKSVAEASTLDSLRNGIADLEALVPKPQQPQYGMIPKELRVPRGGLGGSNANDARREPRTEAGDVGQQMKEKSEQLTVEKTAANAVTPMQATHETKK